MTVDVFVFGQAGTQSYHLGQHPTAGDVVDRFVMDGADGQLQMQVIEELAGKTRITFDTDGQEKFKPYTITHSLHVYRRANHGFAVYERVNDELAELWLTDNPMTMQVPPWHVLGFAYTGDVPDAAVMPIENLERAMHEFADTGRRPTSVHWQQQPVPSYGDGGIVLG